MSECECICVCVLDGATGVKQMDCLRSLLVRVYTHTHTHTHTAWCSHIRDRVFAHSLGGWEACSVCVCQIDNVRVSDFLYNSEF